MLTMHSVSSQYLLKRYVPSSFRNLTDYELVAIYQDDGETEARRKMALQTLTFRHIAAIRKHTKHLSGSSFNEDCLFSAWRGMVTAVERFNLDNPKQVKFITYAFWYIRKGAQKWLTAKVKKDKMSFIGWSEDMSDSFESEDNTLEKQEMVAKVNQLLQDFPGDSNVICNFYGVNSLRKTYKQLSAETGRSERELAKEVRSFKKFAKEVCNE